MIIKIIISCLLLDLAFCISKHPILIIVSYDAFRYNFFDTKLVPHMEGIKKMGTYADYLINVFPTKTFPNHHSIATGLYTETHGVIGNRYFDKKANKVVNIGYDLFHYDKSTVPIWRWNEDQGNGRYSATMMWPGANFPYQGKNITYRQGFESSMDWFDEVDTIISWLTDPHKPANLVMFYIQEPDSHGHIYGPNSVAVEDLLRKLDNVTQYLKDQLEKHKLADKTNVIHLSDHGLVTVTPPFFINITQYMPNGTYDWSGNSPCVQITPKKGHLEEVYNALKEASAKNGHFKVYKKEDIPKRWHYKKNPRAPPILVVADVGYAFDDFIISAPEYAKNFNFTLTNSSEFGIHGYDNNVSDMHPFFMARGPKIKKAHKVAPFHTVDLFNLFTEILEIPPRSNNGSMGNIVDILVDKPGTYNISSMLVITVGGVISTVFIISLAAIIALILIKRQQKITTAAALNKRFPQTFQNNIIEAQHLLEAEDA